MSDCACAVRTDMSRTTPFCQVRQPIFTYDILKLPYRPIRRAGCIQHEATLVLGHGFQLDFLVWLCTGLDLFRHF